MNNEELYNDGVELLENILKKFFKRENIAEEEKKQYFISYPDLYHHIDSYEAGKLLINFPLYRLTSNEKVQMDRYLGVLLESIEIRRDIFSYKR